MNYQNFTGIGKRPIRTAASGGVGKMLKRMGKEPTTKLCSDEISIDPTWMDFNIRRRGNHIYFNEEINEVTQMILQIMLRDAVRDVLTEHVGEILGGELSESVIIHLNSPGGYLSSGFALYDYIKTSQIPITCIVEGYCASAATLIMLACPNRAMSPNSAFLMHQCSWGCWGENRLMQDYAANADKAMAKLRAIYMKETKIYEGKPEKEREAYIQHLLEHDYEMDADECEKLGITTPNDDEDEVELDEEHIEKLQECVKKLAEDQKRCNKKREEEEAKAKEAPAKPTKKKAPAKKAEPETAKPKAPAKKEKTPVEPTEKSE